VASQNEWNSGVSSNFESANRTIQNVRYKRVNFKDT